MNVTYRVLATVTLQHEFYKDLRCPDFSIVPGPETVELLKNLGAVYRMSGSKLLILARTNNQERTFHTMPADKRLSFYMISQNATLYNISNINNRPSAHRGYYFTNRSNNQPAGSTLYLSSDIDAYDGAGEYNIGDLVTAGGKVYEAIRKSGTGHVHDTSVTDYWTEKKGTGYVNNNDLVDFTAPAYNFIASAPGTSFTIKIFTYDAAGTKTQVGTDVTQTYTAAQATVPVALDNLSGGYYTIEVNGETRAVYLSVDAVYQNVFGVIDIFNVTSGTRMAMFAAGGSLLHPDYVVNIPGRSVIFKYLTSDQVDDITEANGICSFRKEYDSGAARRSFVSSIPVMLSQQALIVPSFEPPHGGNTEKLALPATDRLTYYQLGDEVYYCVEKFLSY